MKTEFFGEPPFMARAILKSCVEYLDSSAQLNFIVRSSKLQTKKVAEINHFITELKAFKNEAALRGDELMANELFHFQCMIRGVQSCIEVWLHIKDDAPEKAWDSLMDATEYKDVALKIRDYEGIRMFEKTLQDTRRIMFPNNIIYNSPAFSSTIGKCSICQSPFQLCDHVENHIYLGQLCRRVDIQILEANHCAIVSNPRDPRCIMTERSDDNGRMINILTLEETGEEREPDTTAMHLKGRIMSFHSLDLN